MLRERRPLYAARALEAAARARLSRARKEQLTHTQLQHATDARRLIQTAQSIYEERDTAKCLEHAEFGMEQITRKPANLLPGKDKFLQKLHDIVANAFLDQVTSFLYFIINCTAMGITKLVSLIELVCQVT